MKEIDNDQLEIIQEFTTEVYDLLEQLEPIIIELEPLAGTDLSRVQIF
jgi:hypothetical protein